MKKKRGISFLVVLALVFSAMPVTAAEAEGFPDVPQSHWAYEHITRLVRRGVINGKPDGTFAPEEEVTREQFAKLMALRFYLPISREESVPYADVDPDSWAAPYITACRAYLNASRDYATAQMLFRPRDPATREEVTAALMRVMEVTVDKTDTTYALAKFSDADTINPVALPYVSVAAQMGLVTGYPDGTFGPQRPVSRSEAAVLLERAMALLAPEEDLGVAATVGGHDLTVAEMEVYYRNAVNRSYFMEEYYTQIFSDYTPSVDYSADLRQQYTGGELNQSYHDYFLDQAKRMVTEYFALSDAAKAAGYTLSSEAQTQLEELKADMADSSTRYNLSRLDYLRATYGPHMTLDAYFSTVEQRLLAIEYYNAVTGGFAACTQEELEAYYAAHTDLFDGYTYTFAFFDGWVAGAEDEEGNEVPVTEEERTAAMAAAKRQAGELLTVMRAEKVDSAADFSTLAQLYGVAAYELEESSGVSMGSSPVAPWLADPNRTPGDTEMFEMEGQGYYVVLFQGRKEKVTAWEDLAAEALAQSKTEDFVERTLAGYEVKEGPAWTQVGLRE